MNKSNTNQKTRLVNFLTSRKEASIAEASARLRIANPSAVVAALREEGHIIWTNRYTDRKTGRKIYRYRYDVKRSAESLRSVAR